MSETTEQFLARVEVEEALTHLKAVPLRMAHDVSKYGEWRCDYSEWLNEAQVELNKAKEKLKNL